jgi:hypothetical protein
LDFSLLCLRNTFRNEELGLKKKVRCCILLARYLSKYSQMRIRVCMHASMEHAMLTQLTRMHTCVLSLARALSLSPSRLLIFARSNSSPLRSIVLRNCLSLWSLAFSLSLSLSISFADSVCSSPAPPSLPPSLPLPLPFSLSPFLPVPASWSTSLCLSLSQPPCTDGFLGRRGRGSGIVTAREQVRSGSAVYGHHSPAARVIARAHPRVKVCALAAENGVVRCCWSTSTR